mmetsp:Transcript_30098/g.48263  ORF Transcript_30098/g.48263 Transcript_30098/m.48263 type:complete len:224 (+) Transcript_30098:286-957(+)
MALHFGCCSLLQLLLPHSSQCTNDRAQAPGREGVGDLIPHLGSSDLLQRMGPVKVIPILVAVAGRMHAAGRCGQDAQVRHEIRDVRSTVACEVQGVGTIRGCGRDVGGHEGKGVDHRADTLRAMRHLLLRPMCLVQSPGRIVVLVAGLSCCIDVEASLPKKQGSLPHIHEADRPREGVEVVVVEDFRRVALPCHLQHQQSADGKSCHGILHPEGKSWFNSRAH